MWVGIAENVFKVTGPTRKTSWQNQSYCQRKFYIAGIGIFYLFASVTLTLTRWPSYTTRPMTRLNDIMAEICSLTLWSRLVSRIQRNTRVLSDYFNLQYVAIINFQWTTLSAPTETDSTNSRYYISRRHMQRHYMCVKKRKRYTPHSVAEPVACLHL